MLKNLTAICLRYEHIITGMSLPLPNFVPQGGLFRHMARVFALSMLNLLIDDHLLADRRSIVYTVVNFDNTWHGISPTHTWAFRLMVLRSSRDSIWRRYLVICRSDQFGFLL